MYENLIQYLIDNEHYDLADDVKNDTNVAYMILFIKDHLEETTMIETLDTGIIHDMFLYYVNHK